ncbi:MAG: hypothetical protein R3F61_11505 [Myxococcota bacterium]
MAGIKVGAHPMLVAVAMGLLGPSVLFDDESPSGARTVPAGAAPTSRPDVGGDALSFSLLPMDEAPPVAPSDEEFARVEHLWHEVRTLT